MLETNHDVQETYIIKIHMLGPPLTARLPPLRQQDVPTPLTM
jgi:hypothetical protein